MTASTEEDLYKIWDKGYLKVFLSHKSESKQLASELKGCLAYYGVSCFVAHEDIEPTKQWIHEIEKALSSADALIPLLTTRFYESQWTDQEIGIAFGRGIPIIPVKFDVDPQGFIGRYQAVLGKKEISILALELFNLMYSNNSLKEQIIQAIVARLETSKSFSQTNSLIPYIENLPNLHPNLVDSLERTYKKNSQVREAFTAEEKLPELIHKWRNPGRVI